MTEQKIDPLEAEAKAAAEKPKRMLMTHPHDGHGPNDTCRECEPAPADERFLQDAPTTPVDRVSEDMIRESSADEREALARVVSRFGYKGYPSNGDYEEADAILADGFHRNPQPTEGEPSDRIEQAIAYIRASWMGAGEPVRNTPAGEIIAILRGERAFVADQGGER